MTRVAHDLHLGFMDVSARQAELKAVVSATVPTAEERETF